MNEISTPMVWRDDFATGVDEIDEQHKILIHTLQEANQLLINDHSVAVLENITRDLLSYALYHFDTEEELMQQYNYQLQEEDNAAHLAQHRGFSEKIVSIRNDLKSGTLISREDLINFLSNWLTHHILNTDKRLGAHICSQRAGK